MALSALSLNAGQTSATTNSTQTISVAAGSTYTDFYLGKFNTGLGTLTGVEVNVVYSTLAGSVLYTNGEGTPESIGLYDSAVTVKGAVAGLGFSQRNGTVYDVVTSPNWATTELAGNTSQLFTIGNNQNALANDKQSIGSGYWAAYSSIGGVGSVLFQVRDVNNIQSTGAVYTVDSSGSAANTQLMVTYTYDTVPVPEPSTVIVQLLICAGAVGLFVVRRRRAAAVRA